MSEFHLQMWTIYSVAGRATHIAYRFVIHGGNATRTEDHRIGHLEVLRQHFMELGLFCMPRGPHEAPNVIESWL